MSILIPGMKMPENCLECDLRSFDEYCPFTDVECLNIGRQDSCPLIEVPTPHGNLIDASTRITVPFWNGNENDYYEAKMSIADILDEWADEGCPSAVIWAEIV